MAEELMVVLKRSENLGFGFSLWGTKDFPHVIYDIMENSPAAECGEVEAGDVLVKVNGTDVHPLTTKEVLKCLRLSKDRVTLELKRDPKIKAKIREHLAQTSNLHHPHHSDIPNLDYHHHSSSTSSSSSSSSQLISPTGSTKSSKLLQQQQYLVGGGGSSSTSNNNNNNSQLGRPHGACHRVSSSDPACRPSRIPQAIKSPTHQSNVNLTTSTSSASKSAPQSPHGITKQQSNTNKLLSTHIPTSNGNYSNNFISSTNSSCTSNGGGGVQQQPPPPPAKARFEAYMMTGDLILNLSRTPQSSGIIATQSKKVDSLRDSPVHGKRRNGSIVTTTAPHAKYDSSPSPPTLSSQSDDIQQQHQYQQQEQSDNSKFILSNNKLNLKDNTIDDKNLETSSCISSINNLVNLKNNKTNNSDDNSDSVVNNIDDIDNLNKISTNNTTRELRTNLNSLNNLKKEGCVTSISLSSSSSSSTTVSTTISSHIGAGGGVTSSSSSTISATKLSSRDQIDTSLAHGFNNLSKLLRNNDSLSSSSNTGGRGGGGGSGGPGGGDLNSSPELSFSVPTSPTSLSTPLIDGGGIIGGGESSNLNRLKKESSNSVPTSPESGAQEFLRRAQQQSQQHNGVSRTCDAAGFRTSRSEDHLQATQRDGGLGAVIPIDIDEDVNSSLNTLLDTRQDSEDSQNSDRDRIVWTYNAPIPPQHNSYNDNSSHSSSLNSSPQRSDSPASPTSVSSSVMSSNSSSKGGTNSNGFGGGGGGGMNGGNSGMHNLMCPFNGDQSVSEAVSNISSPDYQDDDNLLSSKDLAMAISDPSDSDSTILVSEAHHHHHHYGSEKDHRLVIQVKNDNQLPLNHGYTELKDSEDELATLTDDPPTVMVGQDGRESSPPISDDGSDVDSLHSYHYSPKAVDIPSAVRLAKRLYSLDGFKKSDVSRHLSKNNDFSRAVAEEYLKYFSFEKISLDEALRQFLQQFSLSGETQERERVLVHFSKRYLDCNANCFNSQDAVHTLTCAIMLLNTDLHGPNIGRRMTCSEFIENLAELNDGENFPKDILKYLYQAIKSNPLQWALDEDYQAPRKTDTGNSLQGPPVGPNPFLETPQNAAAIEYKKGYVMRKCCYDSNNKKTPFGKRSWKMFYCTLRDLVLYLHKDEHGFRKNQMSDNVHNAIRIHHALATKAMDYTKKQHVFRLQTSDQAEYLFQTSDSKELQSWIDTINFVCASFSATPLEPGVGNQKRFQRPLLPSTHTKLSLREQLESHENKVTELTIELDKHRHITIPSKGLALQNYKEKDAYLQYELKRYKSYVNVLKPKLDGDDPNSYFPFLRKPNDDVMLPVSQQAITSRTNLNNNNNSTATSPTGERVGSLLVGGGVGGGGLGVQIGLGAGSIINELDSSPSAIAPPAAATASHEHVLSSNRARLTITDGDTWTTDLTDQRSLRFQHKSRDYRERINLIIRRSDLRNVFEGSEILALDGYEENSNLTVHFILQFDPYRGAVSTADLHAIFMEEIIASDRHHFTNLTIDPDSLHIHEIKNGMDDLPSTSLRHLVDVDILNETVIVPPFIRTCQPITINYCRSIGYNTTTYPNFFGHNNNEELNLKLITFRELVDAECFRQAFDFICRLLQPPCEFRNELNPTPGPVCREYCQAFWNSCSDRIPERLKKYLDCERYPESSGLQSCYSRPGCVAELEANAFSARICDGIADCADLNDEATCAYCPKNTLYCGRGRACVQRISRCDGKSDCPDGSDEKDCLSIAPLTTQMTNPRPLIPHRPQFYSDGFALFSEKGDTGKLCAEGMSGERDANVRSTVAESLCKALGYEKVKFVEIRNDTEPNVSYVRVLDPRASEISFVRTPCNDKRAIYVACDSLECGVQSVSINMAQSLSKMASPGDWPWHVALYRDDSHVCDGTLISPDWVLTTDSCFQGQPKATWLAIFGSVRLHSNPPWKQRRRIVGMVKSPVEGSTAALIRLESPVNYSDFIRPICLPDETQRDEIQTSNESVDHQLPETQAIVAPRLFDYATISKRSSVNIKETTEFFEVPKTKYSGMFDIPESHEFSAQFSEDGESYPKAEAYAQYHPPLEYPLPSNSPQTLQYENQKMVRENGFSSSVIAPSTLGLNYALADLNLKPNQWAQCNTLGWSRQRDHLQRVQLKFGDMAACENVSIATVNSMCAQASFHKQDCNEEEFAGTPVLCLLPDNRRWALEELMS